MRRLRRFQVGRPAGLLAGTLLAAAVLPRWVGPVGWWGVAAIAVAGALPLLFRSRPWWVTLAVASDVILVGGLIVLLDLRVAVGGFLWASHLLTSFFRLPRRAAWAMAALTAAVMVLAAVLDGGWSGGLTDPALAVVETVFLASGLVVTIVDLDLIAGLLRNERIRRQQDLDQAHRMAELRAMVVRSVSHELRTPLTSIRGFADLLSDGDLDLSRSERAEFSEQISAEAVHLSRVVEDLLAASSLDAGQLTVRQAPVRLDTLVADIVARFRVRGMAIETDVDPHHVVFADVDRIGQIVRNLLSNARKYGLPPYRVETTREGRTVTLAVIDNGPGVALGDVERIFEDFTQVGQASPTTGTGLGLGISRRIARAMQGDLRCAPAQSGARFELKLPAVSVTAADVVVAEADGNRTRRGSLDPPPVLKTGEPTRRSDASGGDSSAGISG